jgi:hypothetical protein
MRPGSLLRLPSADLEVMESVRSYEEWHRSEGLPLITGFYVEDLATIDLQIVKLAGGAARSIETC